MQEDYENMKDACQKALVLDNKIGGSYYLTEMCIRDRDINYYFQMAMGDGMGCTFAFNLDEFCRNFKHFPVQADSCLLYTSEFTAKLTFSKYLAVSFIFIK